MKHRNSYKYLILFLTMNIIVFMLTTIHFSNKLKMLEPTSFSFIDTTILDSNLFVTLEDTIEDYVVAKIKKHEGFRSNPYYCAGGHLTIGYGHLMRNTDTFKKLSHKRAERILRQDFNKSLRAALRLSPILKEDTNIYKRYAIAHFIFGKGSGNYSKSRLKYLVDNQLDIRNEIRRWNKIHNNGKVITSKWLSDINEWRIKLYYYGH
jgi:lysozyme